MCYYCFANSSMEVLQSTDGIAWDHTEQFHNSEHI